MSEKVYSVFIGDKALDKNKELLNPRNRTQGIPPDETLISCKYDMALNSAGNCTFVMPPKHPYISEITPMVTEVAIAEIDNIVWFGRVTDMKSDFYGRLEVHCEGALAFLNDSVQWRMKYEDMEPATYLAELIYNHNMQVADNRKINYDPPTRGGESLSGELDYKSTMQYVQDFLDERGGYIYVMLSKSGALDMYWIDSRDFISSQTVSFGKNLLNLSKTVDRSEVFTKIIPIGADVEVEITSADDSGEEVAYIDEQPLHLGMKLLNEETTAQTESETTDEDEPKPIRYKLEGGFANKPYKYLCIDTEENADCGQIVRVVRFYVPNK